MTTAADVLKIAKGEIGYVEGGGPDGHSGNVTKYWAELDPPFQKLSWCACFVSWVFKHAGMPLPFIDHKWGYAGCRNLVTYAKKPNPYFTWVEGRYQAGDIIIFDWMGDGTGDHTGIVVSDDGRKIITIEGNTSGTDAGSQRNGGGVYQRVRYHGPTVLGAARPKTYGAASIAKKTIGAAKAKASTAAAKVAKKVAPKRNPYHAPTAALKVGASGDAVRFVQWAIGAQINGDFGPETVGALKKFQTAHGLVADGVVGPKTCAALATITR